MAAALRARFLLTSGHVVATGLAAHTLPLAGNDEKAALALASASFVLAIGCLVAGIDVFSRTNGVHVACHFLGGVMLARAVLVGLPGVYLWHVVLVAHVPPSLCSLDAARRLFLSRASPLRY